RVQEGEGIARAPGRAAGRLLGEGKASVRLPCRLGLRRAQPRAGDGETGAAQAQELSVRRKPRAAQSDHLGRARAGRGGEVPELDRGRSSARARVPAAARRRRREGGKTNARCSDGEPTESGVKRGSGGER